MGHFSQNVPDRCGSSHTHLPHTHFPWPLQINPSFDTQLSVETGQLQVSPVQPGRQTHSPETHRPCPEHGRKNMHLYDNIYTSKNVSILETFLLFIYL